MCLRQVFPKGTMLGYKGFFHYQRKEKQRPIIQSLYTNNDGFSYKIGDWNKAKKNDVKALDNTLYKSGYHFFFSALDLLQYLSLETETIIGICEFKNVHTLGSEYGLTTAVANEMKIVGYYKKDDENKFTFKKSNNGLPYYIDQRVQYDLMILRDQYKNLNI